jgi:DNA transposition AAA+ family ATPase
MAQDILSQIANEARRLRVARKLPPEGEPIPYNLVGQVQEDFRKFQDVTGLSLADVARRMGRGFSGPTLSSFANFDADKNREFKGDLDRITRGVNTFMESFARQATAPRPEGFITTAVADFMLKVIRKTIDLRSMSIISSDSGRGKTMTARAAASVYPGAVYVRVKRCARTAAGLADLLGSTPELRIRNARTLRQMQIRIIDMLKGTGRVLLIDEAHQLSSDALEFIRDIHDECEIPIVLFGTRKLGDNTDDDDIFYGQFASRVALRYDVNNHVRRDGRPDSPPDKPIHTVDDIKKLFDADSIRLTGDAEVTLAKLANLEGFGGLRLCVQVVRVAAVAAESRGTEIDAKLILAVLRDMHGKVRAVGRIQKSMEEQKVKVA